MDNRYDQLKDKLVRHRQNDIVRKAEMERLASGCEYLPVPDVLQWTLDKAGDLLIAAGQQLKLSENARRTRLANEPIKPSPAHRV